MTDPRHSIGSHGRVIVAGSINMDVMVAAARFPAPGETVAGTNVALLPGGKGANQAVAAARLGASTSLIGCVGADAFGADLLRFLRAERLDLSHVAEVAAPTGTAVIMTANAHNMIVVVPGANALVGAEAVDAVAIAAGDVLVSQFEIPQATIRHFFLNGRAAGAITILNPSPAQAFAAGVLACVDILVLNETELGWFAGTALDDQASDDVIFAAARKVRHNEGQTICVTASPAGRMLRRLWRWPAMPLRSACSGAVPDPQCRPPLTSQHSGWETRAMRLKTEIWVKAYLRVRSAESVSAMVVRHGDDDAGAIFIKIATLDGRATLYGPAPSGFEPTGGDRIGSDRRWVPHLAKPTTTEADVDAYLEQQADFDPDLWVIEVEDRQGRHFLDDWLAKESGA
jgi:ribokinase